MLPLRRETATASSSGRRRSQTLVQQATRSPSTAGGKAQMPCRLLRRRSSRSSTRSCSVRRRTPRFFESACSSRRWAPPVCGRASVLCWDGIHPFHRTRPGCAPAPWRHSKISSGEREFIDYKTSMITDQDPLRGLLFYKDLVFLTHFTFLKHDFVRCGPC